MSYRAFFVAALLLPIVVGYLGYFVPPLEGFYFLWQFVAVPYVISAVLLAALIARSRSLKRIVMLSMCAPFLMSVATLLFFVVIDPPELRGLARVFQLFMSTAPIALIVSYIFVGIVWAFFALARRIGLVETT